MRNDQLAALLSQIETVVQGLSTLADSVVFLGGAITSLLITDSNVLRVRPTKDVDIIVNVSRTGYYKLEAELRSHGFVQKLTGNEPICRWHYAEVAVDVMPTDKSILNFGNRWYPLAFSSSEILERPSGNRIRLIPATLFICSKIEAFYDRGNGNFEESQDMEDIVAVIDGRPELVHELPKSSAEVREFITQNFHTFLENGRFMNSIEWHLPYGSGGAERVRVIEERMRAMCAGEDPEENNRAAI